MRKLALIGLMFCLVGCATPISDPARWDPTTYCATVQKLFGPVPGCDRREGPKDEMICDTLDGHQFKTGLAETNKNKWICDHVGMGEG